MASVIEVDVPAKLAGLEKDVISYHATLDVVNMVSVRMEHVYVPEVGMADTVQLVNVYYLKVKHEY